MAHILDTIVARKKEEVAMLKVGGVRVPAPYAEQVIPTPRGFRRALLDYQGVAIIAEAKKASPSKGLICPDFDPVKIAKEYEKNGAQALSVLTDVDFFQGSLLYLLQAREAVKIPVLRKEFIIDPLQIKEAHVCGADAILLMASILDGYQLKDFMAQATEYSIDCLVEVHDEAELTTVLGTDADLIGINNRNLKDFSMDTSTTFRLRKMIPKGIAVVGESGLKTAEDIQALGAADVSAALIGETLMRVSPIRATVFRDYEETEKTMNTRTRIKMCGLSRIKDIEIGVSLGLDALGFIFYDKSPRNITPDFVRDAIAKIPPFVDCVGVFVNRDRKEVEELVEYCGLSHVQLHGDEDYKYCERIERFASPCHVIKAFRVSEATTSQEFTSYEDVAHGYLLDTYIKGNAGGTGETFDWDIIAKLDLQRPVILAGGLTPDNIEEAITAVRPFGVDVNSGVEIEPGIKDHAKLIDFVQRVHRTDSME